MGHYTKKEIKSHNYKMVINTIEFTITKTLSLLTDNLPTKIFEAQQNLQFIMTGCMFNYKVM